MDSERISPHSAGNAAEAQQESIADILIELATGLNPTDKGTPITTKAVPLPTLVEGLTSHVERDSKIGPYFCCPMSGSSRNGTDAQPWRLFVFDFDGKAGVRPDPEKSKAFFAPWYHIGYTTHSYTPQNGKHRVVLVLDRDVTPAEYRELFDAWAEVCPFEPDSALNHPDQPVFTPSCPPGAERLAWLNEAGFFEVDTFLDDYRAQRNNESRAAAEWKQSGDSVIAAFNSAHSVTEILERNGYQRRGKRYQHPNSESGIPGLSILKDGRLCFSHANDLLGDGKPHDAFDVWRILESKGDARQAVKEAAKFLGIDWKPTDSGKDHTKASGADQATKRPKLVCVNIAELLVRELPPITPLIGPIGEQSLSMVYAWRGVGKTHFSLNLAYAVAVGGAFLGWSAPNPAKVLYIDGEMPGASIQARLSAIIQSHESECDPEYFGLLTPDLQDTFMPDLATLEGQEAVEDHIQADTKLIIVDNLSALVRRGGRENDAESWLTVAEWAMFQRSRGRSVLFVHHAGKGGQQRGTSKREDILDTVICLSRPSDYDAATEGARFNVELQKDRHHSGIAPFEAKLTTDARGAQIWATRTLESSRLEQIIELAELGMGVTDIASELGINKSNVSRALKKAESEGLYSPRRKHSAAKVIDIKTRGRRDLDEL